MITAQITLLGCGKMGSAMLKGWLADPKLNAQFTVIEPYAEHLGWTGAHQQVVSLAQKDVSDPSSQGPNSTMRGSKGNYRTSAGGSSSISAASCSCRLD